MKNLKYFKLPVIGLALGLTLSTTSCENSLNVNTDPNSFTDVPISTILPAAQVNIAYALGGDASRYSGSIVQYYGGHRGQPLEYAQYQFSASTSDTYWTNMYANILGQYKAIMNKSEASGDKIYYGIAQISSALIYSVLTDIYGDIPYTESLMGTADVSPKYDTQESIYAALILLINDGISNIKSGAGASPGTDDLIYGGNATKWEKFANSLKLRLLNHLTKVQANAAADFLATSPALITDNADNAKVSFGSTAANANPIYQFDVLSGRKDQAVASTIVNYMKTTSDPRISKFFYPVANDGSGLKGGYFGNLPGNNDDDSGENKYSRVGAFYASISAPVVLLSAAETQFIVAEIQFRKGDLGKSETAYEAAVTSDLNYLGLTGFAQFMASDSIKFDGTLKRIMTQKWITMFQAPYESWTDWRRTGIPTLAAPVVNFNQGVVPRRLPYPQLELNLNRASIEAGPGVKTAQETMKSRVWWDAQ